MIVPDSIRHDPGRERIIGIGDPPCQAGPRVARGRRLLWHLLGHQHAERTDRKSTRLNSSHPSISYAVFCLKKKKNKSTAHGRTYALLQPRTKHEGIIKLIAYC